MVAGRNYFFRVGPGNDCGLGPGNDGLGPTRNHPYSRRRQELEFARVKQEAEDERMARKMQEQEDRKTRILEVRSSYELRAKR